MDANVEDRMIHQIEKSLSNNINDNLFTSGRVTEDKKSVERSGSLFSNSDYNRTSKNLRQASTKENAQDYTSDATYNNAIDIQNEKSDEVDAYPQLSRAEYIRQAREACIKQMNVAPSVGRNLEDRGEEDSTSHSEQVPKKKVKGMKLFREDVGDNEAYEEASFRALIIRTVCAIVIFLSIFIIDKFNIKLGDFSNQTIQEFVTGKDSISELEEMIVSFLK
ncbi:MAG TPA: hypothetical protein VJZ06_01200 [Mobilitalea sp.]|nr:hypothetical protein [Mobilitalea sp.]